VPEIRHLVEEWLKSGEDRVPDVIRTLLQENTHVPIRSLRLGERYRHGELYLQLRVTNDGVVFTLEDELKIFGANCSQDHCSVFVDVYEFVENVQDVLLIRIPGTVRLEVLNERQRLSGDTHQPILSRDGILEMTRTLANRELQIEGPALAKLPYDVVEAGTQIGEAITDYKAQLRWRIRELGADKKQIRIGVFLSNYTALLTVINNQCRYGCEVFLCPAEFEAGTI
jgi:hypothetical protein